jgi:hypothetical protein
LVFFSIYYDNARTNKHQIKIDTKTVPTYFGTVPPSSSGSPLFELAKVTLVKVANYGTSVLW